MDGKGRRQRTLRRGWHEPRLSLLFLRLELRILWHLPHIDIHTPAQRVERTQAAYHRSLFSKKDCQEFSLRNRRSPLVFDVSWRETCPLKVLLVPFRDSLAPTHRCVGHCLRHLPSPAAGVFSPARFHRGSLPSSPLSSKRLVPLPKLKTTTHHPPAYGTRTPEA